MHERNHGAVLDVVRFGGLHATEVRYGAGRVLGTHAHDTATVWVLLEGGATERRGAGIVEERPMEVLVRGAGERHDNQYHARGARSLVVELDPTVRAVREAFAGRPCLAGSHVLARRLVAAFRSPARAGEVEAAVRAILDALRAAPRARTPAWLEWTRETLIERLADPPSLEELGRAAGVHPVHLAQSFRARWGTTPRGFVRAHRVFRAIELITSGTPLARAASEVGFCDQSHMTRAVARARSAPPGAFVRRIPAEH